MVLHYLSQMNKQNLKTRRHPRREEKKKEEKKKKRRKIGSL